MKITSKDLIKKLKKKGWVVSRVTGSHYIMKNGSRCETIPYHNTDLKKGLLEDILKRTGLK